MSAHLFEARRRLDSGRRRGHACPARWRLAMIRRAFKMQLHPGVEAEYAERHQAIWPELAAALREAGVSDYSIFLDPETLTLFAVQKLTDDHTSDDLPNHPAVKKWWA